MINKEYIEKVLGYEIYDLTTSLNEECHVVVKFTIKPPKVLDYVEIDPNTIFRKDGTAVAIRG